MLGKKDTRKDDYLGTRMTPVRSTETTRTAAARLLMPEGKNPYYKGEMALRNLDELDRNLASFDAGEALWVADWIDYLGDRSTAIRIRKAPADFKRIVHERTEELRRLG